MNIIDFNEAGLPPLYNRTSKGDQPKWFFRGNWYKADSLGYEGLSEVVVSRLLRQTGDLEAATYEPVCIRYNGREYMGCVSPDFKARDEELVPLERMHLAFRGTSLAKARCIRYAVNLVEAVTGLRDAGRTLTAWLEADAFFLNEDRHTNNIAFLRNPEKNSWRFCPIYDNGLSLLSDLGDYPPDEKLSALKKKVRAKPFATHFAAQVSAAERLFGKQLCLGFGDAEIEAALSGLPEYYDEKILIRVGNLIRTQTAALR